MPQVELPREPPGVTVNVSFALGHLTTNPEVAHVRVGQRVRWRVTSDKEVVWRVYFGHRTPFSKSEGRVKASSGDIDLGLATGPGYYKYGVRVEDPERAEILADDDPVLEVLR